jgi:hypothetical protein
MFQRLDGVREANRCLWVALTPFILQKSRMRKRARTDLCGGRSAMIVPTATMCFLWTAYLGSGRRNSPTSDNPTYEKLASCGATCCSRPYRSKIRDHPQG